jgi:catechol 2,3-dioxygenase-like lactoylglutathione lyase family enzyme
MDAPPPALNLVVIRSKDIERAYKFYSAMGLLMWLDSHGSSPSHYVSVVCGLAFEIYPLPAGQPPTTATRLGFQVDSVDELVPMMIQVGGSLVSGPRDISGGRHAVVTDLDGHRVELFTPTRGHQVAAYLEERPLPDAG